MHMLAEVYLGIYTFACEVCLPRGPSCPLIIYDQSPYMSIREPLRPWILIHY